MTELSTFTRVCALSELPEEGVIGVEAAGTPIAVVRANGEIFALLDVCSHAEVALSEGEVYDHTIECWMHGSCFDLRTGNPTGPPATKPVPTFAVKVEGDDVFVSVDARGTAGGQVNGPDRDNESGEVAHHGHS